MLWSDRSTNAIFTIQNAINDYIKEKNYNHTTNHGMVGLNDRILVHPVTGSNNSMICVSIILSWAYADADLAVLKFGDVNDKPGYVTNDFLEYINQIEKTDPERWEIAENIRNNNVKYYPKNFDDSDVLSTIIQDIKLCLDKISLL